MKKVLFAALALTCLSFTGLFAQKGNAKPTTETSDQGHGSTAKKGVGKGSPLIQRNAGSTSSDAAESKPVESMEMPAPAAPAKTGDAAPVTPSKASEATPATSTKAGDAAPAQVPPKTNVSPKPAPAVEPPKN